MHSSTKHHTGSSNAVLIVGIAAFAALIFLAMFRGRSNEDAQENFSRKIPPINDQPSSPVSNSGGRAFARNTFNTSSQSRGNNQSDTSDPDQHFSTTIEKEIETALMHGSRSTREQLLQQIATQLATNDLNRATALLEEIFADSKTEHAAPVFVKAVVDELMQQDPDLAVAWADVLPESMGNLARDTALKAWLASDVFAAAEWVNRLEEPNLRKTFTQQVALNLLNAPPSAEALNWAQTLANSPDASQHMDSISRIWAKNDLNGASQWAQGLSDPGDQTKATTGVASTLAEQGLDAVVNWVSQLPNEDGYRDEVIMYVAYDLDGQHNGMGLELAKKFNHIYSIEREQSGSGTSIPTPSQ
jgi:hypothetical protein